VFQGEPSQFAFDQTSVRTKVPLGGESVPQTALLEPGGSTLSISGWHVPDPSSDSITLQLLQVASVQFAIVRFFEHSS